MFVKNPEYFLAIVKERSISKAAERLYLSQPYLSQYLAKLESNLGVVLLDRSHTPLQPPIWSARAIWTASWRATCGISRPKNGRTCISACPPGVAPPFCPISFPNFPSSTPTST